jgi:hypothetical protein
MRVERVLRAFCAGVADDLAGAVGQVGAIPVEEDQVGARHRGGRGSRRHRPPPAPGAAC